MNILLVFDNTGDVLPFEVKYNYQLIEFFVDQVNQTAQNSFFVDGQFVIDIDTKISGLNWSISKTNEILYALLDKTIEQQHDSISYLDQRKLNNTHSIWAESQKDSVHIDKLRFNKNINKAKIGSTLHEMYPDDIRIIRTAEALEKLGYIFPYEEINMGIHRLENSFSRIEFKTHNKWEVIKNPLIDNMITNNDIINFSFGYTYVGRQYHNKFKSFDTNLEFSDNYNYETLEFAFQVNLSQPESIPFSAESLAWANKHNIKLVAEQVPIANLVDLEKNLFHYRKILYTNIKQGNKAKLIIQ